MTDANDTVRSLDPVSAVLLEIQDTQLYWIAGVEFPFQVLSTCARIAVNHFISKERFLERVLDYATTYYDQALLEQQEKQAIAFDGDCNK